ncbi:MAG: AIPR family protein, partial [Candidatus Thiodiazotropha sp. (ex Lucinoma kastoroae)]|nr:AIPR family protein [Candidatus Thiodiazotropha sp. (ex Lucinoma kastoroae)]
GLFALAQEAGATPEVAATASIDGGNDHGIDSVFVAADGTLWLVQSKFIASGVGQPDLGDVTKFKDGVVDLLAARYDRFNEALNTRKAEVEAALSDENHRVKVVLAHTGGAISEDRRNIFSDLEHTYNATEPGFLRCHAYGLSTRHGLQLDAQAADPIDTEVELADFDHVNNPYRGFYGRMAAKSLAEMEQHYGDQIVEMNIRRFKGSTVVNEGMLNTLGEEADHFFYFNNGVTFLCSGIQQLPPFAHTRELGKFRVRGISIINGAQTVGTIAEKGADYYKAHSPEVLATFISLNQAPVDFGAQVTQYRNRQNAVDLEDFAALDERQEQWRQTLEMAGISYLYKHGDDDPPLSDTVFSVREAAPALACFETANHWPAYIVAAKKDQKRLFKQLKLTAAGSPLDDAYGRLFTDALTARELWRMVQISRLVQKTISDRAKGEAAADAEILRQGKWLILHVLLLKTQLRWGADLSLTEDERNRISVAIDAIANELINVVKANAWSKQPRAIFENQADVQTVKNSMMAALTQAL